MTTIVRRPISWSTGLRYLVFVLGLVLLLFSWYVLYFLVSLTAEALLAPWQARCGWYTCPPLGTLPRTINDFFAGFGRDLPSVVFLLVCGSIFAIQARRSKDRTWLPLIFFLANVVFVAADLLATLVSWSVSDRIVGPRIGFDNGYHRTWYGIVATCLVWIIFWFVLMRLPLQERARVEPATSGSVS